MSQPTALSRRWKPKSAKLMRQSNGKSTSLYGMRRQRKTLTTNRRKRSSKKQRLICAPCEQCWHSRARADRFEKAGAASRCSIHRAGRPVTGCKECGGDVLTLRAKTRGSSIGDALDAHGVSHFTLARPPSLPLRSNLSFGLTHSAAPGLFSMGLGVRS